MPFAAQSGSGQSCVETTLQLGERQGGHENLAAVFGELVQHGFAAVAGVNEDVGIDQIGQAGAQSSSVSRVRVLSISSTVGGFGIRRSSSTACFRLPRAG